MNNRTQDFALGLTAIVFVALFLATFFFLYDAIGSPGTRYVVHFDHDRGMAPLKVGSPVILGGSLDVGTVTDVHVEQVLPPTATKPTEEARAAARTVFAVELEIRDDANVTLWEGCRIATNQPPIGGQGYVAIIDVGLPGQPVVQPIAGLPPRSMAASIEQLSGRLLDEGGLVDQIADALDIERRGSLMYKLSASLDDVNAITARLSDEMTPTQRQTLLGKVHAVMDDINATTAALRAEMDAHEAAALMSKVHGVLTQVADGLRVVNEMVGENRPLVRETLVNVRDTTQTLHEEIIAPLGPEFDRTNPESLLAKVHVAMGRVDGALADVQDIAVAGERLIKTSRPKLELALDHLVATSEKLDHAALKILLNPQRLLKGTTPKDEEQLRVFEAARDFAYAASELDTASARLQALIDTLPSEGQLSAADNEELRSIQGAVRASFERFEQAEQTLWQKLK
jgi:ABC-type transporter Mla subunit MlaD